MYKRQAQAIRRKIIAVTADSLRVRSGPGTDDFKQVDSCLLYTSFLAIENAVIGSVEDGAPWLKLRLRAGERPAQDGSYSAQVDYVHYYGRTKPEPYTCGMQDASHDFAFTLRDLSLIHI